MAKKILYIESNKDGTIGGSYYSLYNLIKGLNRKKYEPYVMFCDSNALIPTFKKLNSNVIVWDYDPSSAPLVKSLIDLIKWPVRLLREVLFQQPRILNKIRKISPDMVHLNNGYSSNHAWMIACKIAGIKIIAHNRGDRYPCSFRTRCFVRLLDAVICVSDAYRGNVVKQNLKIPIVKTVHNGLDPNRFTATASRSSEIRKQFGIKKDDVLIGMIGNIDYWKGQIVFAKAFNLIKKEYGEDKGLFVGKTAIGAQKYEEEIRQYVLQNNLSDSLYMTGYRNDIPEVLDTIDMFVHASVEPEPFARTILEAMAYAKPIIATDAGGCPEQIVDKKTGLLYPMGDETAMAEAIIYYLSDMNRARLMGTKAKERLNRLFTVDSMVKGVEEVYEKVLLQ